LHAHRFNLSFAEQDEHTSHFPLIAAEELALKMGLDATRLMYVSVG
jgi:hypothetical protein